MSGGESVDRLRQAAARVSHAKCQTERGHICQEPSGRTCVERGCDEPAGTWWGLLWCPPHDQERLDRVGASLEAIAASFGSPL